MSKFTKEEMKPRAIRRVAEVIYGQWEENRGVHSRIFEVLVPDEFVIDGESVKGNEYREHIVPCVLIRNHATKMYTDGCSIDDVASMINEHLRIVLISTSEANHIDQYLGLKQSMPEGWKFGQDNPLARLIKGGVKLVEPN